jgi:tetratricopeptide (TPR) repeat protein
VNVAARLEQLAEPGEVLIGEPTWQLLGDGADVKELAPATLKGKSAPLRVFRLLSVAPPSARTLTSPMVGRTEQLQLLQHSFAVARRDRACSLFTVLGSAGVGKSRLVAEFLRDVDATVVGGRCLSYGEGIAYWPLVEILTQLRSGATSAAVAELVATDPAVGSAVAAVLDEGTAATSSAEIAWAVRRLLERVAEDRPLVVVVDDLHWAEPTLLDLLDHVVDLSRDFPILVLGMARPELLELRPGWGGGKLNSTTVLLEPLAADETDELLRELAPELDDALRRRMRTASGGNPLFVEALVPLAASAAEGELTIPPTIQALVAARLDQLDDAERRVLEAGSVEGQMFHRGTVAALLPDEPDVANRLAALVRKDLLRPDRAVVAGQDAFRFRHLLIRDAAYEALSKSARADLHQRFASWLEQAAGLPDLDELTGYHLEQALRYREQLGPLDDRTQELGRVAAARLEAAGRRSLLRGDMAAALNLLDRAQRLRPDSRYDLSLEFAREYALRSVGRLEEAAQRMREVGQAAADRGDEVGALRAHIAYVDSMLMNDPDEWVPEMRALVERARPVLVASGDQAALASLWRGIGSVALMAARFGDAFEAQLEVLRYARLAGDDLLVARWVNQTAKYLAFSPRPVPEALTLLHEWTQDGVATLTVGEMRALLLGVSGQFAQARALHQEMLEAMQARGLTLDAAYGGQTGWFIEMAAGDVGAAEGIVRTTFAALEAAGEHGFASTQACYVGECAYRFGRWDEAAEWAQRGRALTDAEDLITHIWAAMVEAKSLARRGHHDAAVRMADEATVAWQHEQAPIGLGLPLVMYAEVLHLAGLPERSAEQLERALGMLERKGATALVEQSRLLAAGWS